MYKKCFSQLFILLFIIFTACEKDYTAREGYENEEKEEELLLTVWDYDVFDGQSLKNGSHWDYYIKGGNGSAIVFNQSQSGDESFLYQYTIYSNGELHSVYYSENDSVTDKKKYEYIIKDGNLIEIRVFYEDNEITAYTFNYNDGELQNIKQGGNTVVENVIYDSDRNITAIKKSNGQYYHFKICNSKNPFEGIFRSFNIRNFYTDAMFSIASFINTNFILDVMCNNSSSFCWDSHSVCVSADVNNNDLPQLIRKKKYDTQGNLTQNIIIFEFEYH